jgi:hypothetical protein
MKNQSNLYMFLRVVCGIFNFGMLLVTDRWARTFCAHTRGPRSFGPFRAASPSSRSSRGFPSARRSRLRCIRAPPLTPRSGRAMADLVARQMGGQESRRDSNYLGGVGAELEEAGLPVGRLVLELLDLAMLRLALLLQPPDLHRVLHRPNVPITEPQHPPHLP